MPELYLHIGTHKTATTSVQRFFAQNRDVARRHGIWYPELGIADMPDHYAHHRLAHAMAGVDEAFGPAEVAGFFDVVRSSQRDDEVVFISAEPLYRHVLGRDDDADGPPSYERYAQLVRQCVGEFDVTVMVMLRRQDLFAESLYAEQVLSSGYSSTIEEFIEERAALFDYEQRLAVWSEAFGQRNVQVRSFEPRLFETQIEQIFVEWLGGAWDDEWNVGGRRNVTLPRTLVEYKRSINMSSQGSTVNASYRRWLERLASLPVAETFPDLGRYYLDPQSRLALLKQYEAGNRVVAERYLGRERLFTGQVLDELERYSDRPALSARDHRMITKHLLRSIANEA